MLRILFMTTDRSNIVAENQLYFIENAVSKIARCKFAGIGHKLFRREPLNETVHRLYGNDPPDWVIMSPYLGVQEQQYWDTQSFKTPSPRSYKVANWLTDLHHYPLEFLEQLNSTNFDAHLMTYLKCADIGSEDFYLGCLDAPIHFLPNCLNPAVYRPLNMKKIYDIALLGSHLEYAYPLRYLLWKQLPDFVRDMGYHALMSDRPQYAENTVWEPSYTRKIDMMYENEFIVGERYVRTLNQTKIHLFGTSRYKYPLAKFFETMGCGTLAMADEPLTAKELHLKPDENFVAIDEDDWQEKLRYFLKYDDEREAIARAGYEMMLKYHTCDKRAKQLVRFLERNK